MASYLPSRFFEFTASDVMISAMRTAVAAFSTYPKTGKTAAVNIVVGNTIQRIKPAAARLARTGQKKIFKYELYANIVKGPKNAIEKIEFFPDIIDDTDLPRSYAKTNGPSFSTTHDCWGMSTAKLLVTMQDGSTKTIWKRITVDGLKKANFRLVYKPHPVVVRERAFGVEMEIYTPQRPGKVKDFIERVIPPKKALVSGWSDKTTKVWKYPLITAWGHLQKNML